MSTSKELEGVDPGRRRLVRRKQRPDVAQARRAQQRVDQRVRDHVTVGVSCKTARVVEADTSEDERNAVGERVRVDAEADAQVAHPSGTCIGRRCSNTVTVS